VYSAIFLARRNMRARRGRTLLTLLGIILGVAVVLAIQVTNQTTLDSLRRVFDRTTGKASLVVIPVNENRQPLDDDVLRNVEREPGVLAAVPSLRMRTLLASDVGSWQIAFNMSGIAAGNFFQLYGIDPQLDPQVRLYALTAGRMPRPEKYELVIPEKTAREKDLQVF